MRIQQKSLQDIWRELPRPYRVVVVAGLVFVAFSFIYLAWQLGHGVKRVIVDEPGPLRVVGTRSANFLDPSLASDGARVTALAYTAFEPATPADAGGMRIRVAVSEFPCGVFRAAAPVYLTRGEALLAPDGTTTLAEGEVRYETPSIVYDPADRENPWLLFAYRYFWMDNVAYAQRYSMIVLRRAAAPQGPWGREEWVLATAPDHPPPPYQNLVGTFINGLSQDLAGNSGYARPSVVAYRGALLMSLVTYRGSAEMQSVILLASLDRGKSWGYVSTLLTRGDLAGLGNFTRLSGASLLQRGGDVYLAAVLGDARTAGLGTHLFRVRDAARGALQRDGQNRPVAAAYIPRQSEAPTDLGGGYAAYEQSCDAGIVTAEHSGLLNSYQLFRTRIHPPPPQE
jgi:hypothetical protein